MTGQRLAVIEQIPQTLQLIGVTGENKCAEMSIHAHATHARLDCTRWFDLASAGAQIDLTT
mgnify:FL=1